MKNNLFRSSGKQIIALVIIATITFGFVVKKVTNSSAPTEIQNTNEKIAQGKKFLEAKSKEKDVVTLPSGLRYKVLTPGLGAKPLATNTIKAHYHGTLLNGTVFDSSVDRGEPFQFNTESGVIQGWLEVSKLMPVGSKWEIYLPYNLAYGERGAGEKITPFATLIFQIEILEIVK